MVWNFASDLLVRDKSCAVHGKLLLQGTVASSAAALMSECRADVVVTLDLLFRIGERVDLAVCTDLEPGYVADVLSVSLHSKDPKDGPNFAAPPDLMGHFVNDIEACIFCQGQNCIMDMFARCQNAVNLFCIQRTRLVLECSVRSW